MYILQVLEFGLRFTNLYCIWVHAAGHPRAIRPYCNPYGIHTPLAQMGELRIKGLWLN